MNPPALRDCLAEFSAFHVNSHALINEYYQFYNMNLVGENYAVKQTIGLLHCDDQTLVGQAFFAEQAASNVLLIHGYMDHTGLYGKIIRYLLKQHMNVFILDLAGHGLSTGMQVSIDSFFDYTDSLEKFLSLCKNEVPILNWHLFGQSMGGALAMSLHMLGGHAFGKTVLLAPLVRPSQWIWMRELHTMLKPLLYSMPRSFHGNTHDNEFHHFLSRHDTLQTRQIPVKWVSAWREWKKWFLNQPIQETSILLLQGTDDNSVDWYYSLRTIPLLFPNVQIHKIDHARHHMVNESEPYLNKIFGEIDNYLTSDEVTI